MITDVRFVYDADDWVHVYVEIENFKWVYLFKYQLGPLYFEKEDFLGLHINETVRKYYSIFRQYYDAEGRRLKECMI